MSRKYFGTDGIRGTVGTTPITPDFVLKLGFAAGRVLSAKAASAGQASHPTVLIGKDTRISGYMLESALESGFSAAGVNVLLVGPMPTPAVAYLTRALRLSAGIVISASHNPFNDNGIKFFDGRGEKLSDAIESEIETAIDQPMQCVASADLGKARRLDDASGRYIEFCKNTFPSSLSLRGVKLVIDCAHGASYHVAPPVFHELGAEIAVMGHEPDGFNINSGVGATHPQALAERVMREQADYGIALDGDGDRLIMVDRSGTVFDGDQLLYAIVKDRLRHVSVEAVQGVVGTLMTNLGFEHAMHRLHIDFRRAKVGDRYVMEMLKETGWLLGGESSGHILCLDQHTTGDGIVSALQVLAAIVRFHQPLAALVKEFERYPQTLINVPMPAGADWQKAPGVTQACADAQKQLAEQGRLLIRPSGTEPVVRVMVEARQAALAQSTAQAVADALRRL
ncbi:MAG: phosphoglucosamine mutase [Betaproteobacteria bacterium]|nr:phosphoglucosamine mutase [Betaproteobacteria bacterium]